MRKIVTFFFLFAVITSRVLAVSAYPNPIEIDQPDGTKLTIILKGDENIHWATSEDGFTLLVNKDGFYEYAILDAEGDLFFSGILARNIHERSRNDISFLNTLTQDLRYSDSQISLKQQIYESRNSWAKVMEEQSRKNEGSGDRAFGGTKHFPVILVGFQGKPFTKTKAEFEALLNQPGYNVSNAPGSLRDYWLAASYGQLDFTCDVYGPYTLSNSINYYDDACFISGYGYGDPRNMARQAAQLAYNDGCDFSLYDYDNNGYVDGMHIVFAGYGQESGAPVCNSIWSHAWSFPALSLNGKILSRYSCSPELRGMSGSNVTFIGVIAHELGHIFGFPDFYDTDYAGSGGNSVHLDAWCLMASGSWSDNGRTPCFPSAWCRDNAGWISAQILSTPNTIMLPNPQTAGVIYRINTTTNNEYFLLENRQRVGWDYYLPSSGMLIYHVDRNYSGWNNNCINCAPAHRGCYLKQANCGAASTCLHNYTAYPGTTNNTSFTDNSIPNSRSWAGNFTGKAITGITHNTSSRTISFDFMGGPLSPYTVQLSADPPEGGTVSGDGNYFFGESVNVVATPAIGYKFVSWNNGSTVVSLYPSYTFTATTNISLVAYFENLGCEPITDLAINYTSNCDAYLTWTAPPKEEMSRGEENGYYHSGKKILLYDNGPVITHFGAGANGADISVINYFYTSQYGFQANKGIGNSLADDFELLEDAYIHNIDFLAYQAGAPVQSPITGVYVRIWNGNPMQGGSIIWGDLTTNLIEENIYSNINRVLNTAISLADRKLFRVSAHIDHEFPAGVYWIEFSFSGSPEYNGPWSPPVTKWLYPQYGNAIQFTSGNWSTIYESAFNSYFEMPFTIYGVEREPNTEFYNVYRDGTLIAQNIEDPFYLDTGFDHAIPHTWSVSFVCPQSVSVVVSESKDACSLSANDNANLANLIVSAGLLSPAFDPDVTNYTVHVDCSDNHISITGFADDSHATVTGNVTDVALSIGSNYFVIKVTAEDNTTIKYYEVEVFRHPVSATVTETDASICQGDSYNFFGQLLTEEGVYYHTEKEAENCIHHIYQLTLTVNPATFEEIEASICEGSDYNFYGEILTEAGVYYHVEPNTYGCDNTIQLTLTIADMEVIPISAEICQGDSYEFLGEIYTIADVYEIFVYGECTIKYVLTLTVNPISSETIEASICEGESFEFYGNYYTEAGVYYHYYTNGFGCSGTVTLTLTAHPIVTTPIAASIFDGETYDFYGNLLTEEGIYHHTLQSVQGCDSIIELTLTVIPVGFIITATAGPGGTITPSGLVGVVQGTSITFDFEPYDGYRVESLFVDGKTQNCNNGYYTFNNVRANHTIEVFFTTIAFTITATAGPNGTINPEGEVFVDPNGSATFTFTPDPLYKIFDVLVDGKTDKKAISDGFITIKNVKANHTVHVTYEFSALHITATAGPNGTINPEGVIFVLPGGTETFTFTPNIGYKIEEVLVNGKKDNKAAKDGFITIKNIKESQTVHVSFSPGSNAPPLEIVPNELDNVIVYSFSNSVYIKNETGVDIKSVEIFDMMGRIIYQGNVTNRETVITLNVATGMYNVVISSEKKFLVSKISIMKW